MKTRVKIRQFVIFILAFFSIVICLNSCQPNNGEETDNTKMSISENDVPDAHKHNWSSWQMIVPATCCEKGNDMRSCSCGKIESRITEALGHSEGEWVTDKEATCATDGLRAKKCPACGIALITETINATGHKEGEWIVVKDATSSKNGRKNLPCLLCGTVLKTEEIPPELAIYSIDEFSNGLALISTNKGYGYINTKGEIVIEPCYLTAGRFYTEFARVKIDGKYGYINTQGELVIHAQYSSAPEKFDHIAKVEKDGIAQVINSVGSVIYTASKNDLIGEYSNGYFWVESSKETLAGTEQTMCYYDLSGKLVASFSNSKNAEIYSSVNEQGFAYIQKIVRKGSGLYKDQCEFALVNIKTGKVELQGIQSVNGNYYFDSNSDVQYITFVEGVNGDYTCSHEEATWVYELNQTITPMCKDGEWSTYFYLFAPRGTWDGYFANRANEDLANQYYVNISYIVQSWGNIAANFKKDYPAFSGASIKGIDACFIPTFGIRYLVLLKNNSGTIFSAILDRYCDLVSTPTNRYELGYPKQEKINYQYYTLYQFYSGDADIFELDYKFAIARDPNSGLFGYVDLITGEWGIQPQYKSVTNFKGYGEESVAVVNGNTIINTRGEVVFTIAD